MIPHFSPKSSRQILLLYCPGLRTAGAQATKGRTGVGGVWRGGMRKRMVSRKIRGERSKAPYFGLTSTPAHPFPDLPPIPPSAWTPPLLPYHTWGSCKRGVCGRLALWRERAEGLQSVCTFAVLTGAAIPCTAEAPHFTFCLLPTRTMSHQCQSPKDVITSICLTKNAKR